MIPGIFRSCVAPLFARLCAGVLLAAAGATASAVEALLTPEQAQADVQVLTRALQTLHPALTKYRSQAEMDAAFARFEARGNAARTPTAMYLAATELAAAIRCGHTWTNWRNQAGATRAVLLDGVDKLPITVTWVEGRWLVLASTAAGVAAGDAINAINGQSAESLVAQLMPYLRADGSSDGKRLRQLGHDRPDTSQMDILLPLLSPPVDGSYALALTRRDGSSVVVRVPATTLATRQRALDAQGQKPIDEAWQFEVKDGVGKLVLPTFSFWNSKFDWAGFLEQSFTRLNAEKVPYLVIDIRDNEGGDGAIGNKLLSYLIRQPLGYLPSQSVTTYERVPAELRPFLDTWDASFFDRTGDVERITEGTARGKFQLKSRPPVERFIQPGPSRYGGKVYLLVGQPTGGNRRGLNGGQLAWVTLPHSGVAVDIPLLAARYTTSTPDASVAGIDQALQAVQALIHEKRP